MKKLNIKLLFIIIFSSVLPVFSDFPDTELLIYNNTGVSKIYIQLYPYGSLFDGYNDLNPIPIKYTLNSRYYNPGSPLLFPGIERKGGGPRIHHIVGLDGYALNKDIDHPGYFAISNGSACDFGHDCNGAGTPDGEIGFGKYILKIFHEVDDTLKPVCDSILIDWMDFNYGKANFSNQAADLLIFVKDTTSSGILYHWDSVSPVDEKHVFDSSDAPGILQVWRQFQHYNQSSHQWEGFNVPSIVHPPDLGGSISDTNFLIYPLDGRKLDTLYTLFNHLLSGNLFADLSIKDNSATQDTLIDNPTRMNIKYGVALSLDSAKTFDLKYVSSDPYGYFEMNIENNGRLILKPNSKVIVRNKNHLNLANNSKLYLGNGAEIQVEPGGHFCNYGASIRGNGQIVIAGGTQCSQIENYLVKDSAKIILDANAVWEIPDSTTLHFTGNVTALIMKPGSKIKFGEHSGIIIDSSASLIANGAEFSSLDSSKKWDGIVLQNSSYDTIKNCTFKNSKTSISIINSSNFSYLRRIIRNNVFYVPSGGDYKAIYGENNYRILIAGNTFNMPVVSSGSYIYTGVYLKNSSTCGAMMDDDDPVPQYLMNIVNNTFNNGSTSIILANYISSSWPCYIGNNTFNNASDINLIGIKLSGRIKNNNFSSTNVPMAVHLINSSPDMFGNSITARDISLHLAGHCYPNLAPYISDDYLVWTGGKNTLSTVELDNVQLSSTGNVFTDLGKNSFNAENSSAEHIYGFVDSSFVKYDTRDNCWLPDEIAKINLKKYFDSVAVANVNYNENCDYDITPVSEQIDYLGSEMYDTVLISAYDSEDQTSEEDILWTQGKHYMDVPYWNDAIVTFKYLIDNYPDYQNLEGAANYIYECYQALDTTADTSYRNTLYGNLRSYFEDKTEHGAYFSSGDFIDVANEIIRTCDVILGDYDDALNGYEFISLFHPDPNIRLIASWDYEEVEALINSGYGGGEKQLGIRNEELGIKELREKKELQRLEELINDDPVLRKMKESFEKKSEERKEKIEKEISKESKLSETSKENIKKSAQLDKLKEDHAKRNIIESALLNPKEKEKRRMEDMILMTRNVRNQIDKNENVNVVLEYKLEQNYPNPFNPDTKINFTIPRDGKVTLKIYDILGKEVKTLVNEFRNSGSYQVTFSGINLSSGVYYYKIESGSFTQVRKMVLIK